MAWPSSANGSELLLPTTAADAGRSLQISVSVSNAAGSVTSAVAVLTITAVPSGGTLISAAQGGFISANTGAEVEPTLIVPPGALAADATLSVTVQSSTVANLPPEITPLGDVISVGGPSTAIFSTPATLYLAVPDAVPEGKVLAVVELEGPASAQRSSTRSAAKSAAVPARAGDVGNLRRIAAGQGISKAQGAARSLAPRGATILGAGDPLRVLCPDAQAVRGGAALVDLTRAAVRFVVAAVPESACTGNTTTKPRAVIPATTTAPCTQADYGPLGSGPRLVSRHVHCRQTKYEDVRLAYCPPGGQPCKDYGRYEARVRIGTDGPASGLNKTYRVKVQLVATEPGPDSLSGVRVLPVFECTGDPSISRCRASERTPVDLSLGREVEITSTLNFEWSGGDDTYQDFGVLLSLAVVYPGQAVPTDFSSIASSIFSNQNEPGIRCDKKMAVNRGDGCVHPDAPAVLVLNASGATKEAAEHIRDAQAAGSRGGLTPFEGGFVAGVSNGLQRTRVTGLKGTPERDGANRQYACRYATSAIVLRPQSSANCAADGSSTSTCDCDEYPFNSTWNGAFSTQGGLPSSARYVLLGQNREAGRRLVRFYQAERVLDYTIDPGIVFTLENEAQSIPARTGGDDFWVHIE